MGIKKPIYKSISSYLEAEAFSEIKHEFEGGAILAMSGGTINHGVLCGNIYSEIRKKLKDNTSDCKVFGSEIRIHIKKSDSIVYPDAMVICGDLEISEEDKNSIKNPILIIEVLSKSTGNYDRGDKFYKYRQLASFKEYLLINQDKKVVEIFLKSDDQKWEIVRISGHNETFTLQSINVNIQMADLYKNVSL